jgi:hypothetical protein
MRSPDEPRRKGECLGCAPTRARGRGPQGIPASRSSSRSSIQVRRSRCRHESSRRERSPRVLQIPAKRLRIRSRTQTTPGRRPRRASHGLLSDLGFGAEGGIRTPTVLLPPAPQAGASASSATSAILRDAITSAAARASAAVAPAASWASSNRPEPESSAPASSSLPAAAPACRPSTIRVPAGR